MNLTPSSFAEFDDDDAFLVFLGDHEIAHQQFVEKLSIQGFSITSLPLIESPKDSPQWLQDHYSIHLEIAAAINQQDLPDLSSVDLNQEGQYLDWMQLHAYTHDEINTILGINT